MTPDQALTPGAPKAMQIHEDAKLERNLAREKKAPAKMIEDNTAQKLLATIARLEKEK